MILFEKLLANVAKNPKFVHFDDPEVERIFLANFDKDGDGKISIEEAKAITSIDGLFSNNTKIRSLDVLRYTSISTFRNKDILGVKALEQIAFPASISNISWYTFGGNARYLLPKLKTVVSVGSVNGVFPEGFDDNIQECVDYPSKTKSFGWAQPRLKAKVTIIRAVVPPVVGAGCFSGKGKLYVPDNNVQDYKKNAMYNSIADRIYPLSECEYK